MKKCNIYIDADNQTQFLRKNAFTAAITYEDQVMPTARPGKQNAQQLDVLQINGFEYRVFAWHTKTKDSYTIRIYLTAKPFQIKNNESVELGAKL
jgi:thiamine pyrophosphokinase